VIAISESLALEQVSERGRELAGLISSSGRLLEQVLSDVLDFSKIEAGEIQLSDEVFDLAGVVGGIAQLHRASAEAKGLGFVLDIDPAALGTYRGDPVRLTQVLSNLFSNSVKFTEAGAVSLLVTRCDLGLRFEVRDSGIGFGPEVAARLFRRFEQADASIRRRFGGTGLGLAICRSLVERMGGEIHARSEPGLGSQFIFELPLQAAEAVVQDNPHRDPIEARSDSLRVLLAEDHPTNQKVVQLILSSVGVEPVIVENGALALERLKTEPFDVILMDMQMPELDGLSAVQQWRAIEIQEGRSRTPVIMLTANALDEHVAASREAGADDHLAKPIRAAALIAAIEALIVGPDPESASGASHSQSA
jgi:CheY-like chemotaxis protein